MQFEVLEHQRGLAHSPGSTDGEETAIPIDMVVDVTYIIRLRNSHQTAASVDQCFHNNLYLGAKIAKSFDASNDFGQKSFDMQNKSRFLDSLERYCHRYFATQYA